MRCLNLENIYFNTQLGYFIISTLRGFSVTKTALICISYMISVLQNTQSLFTASTVVYCCIYYLVIFHPHTWKLYKYRLTVQKVTLQMHLLNSGIFMRLPWKSFLWASFLYFTLSLKNKSHSQDSMFTLQSSFFASFMCFDVKPLAPQLLGDDDYDEDDISLDAVHTKASECTNFPYSLVIISTA